MRLRILIGRATALLCTAAAIFITTSPTRAQTNPTIRVSALSIESAAEVYYAKDMGFFTKA
jgi:ABC-type nitrate/sulfonate/bicarbonate transport system substrate-binding protein